MKGGTILLVEDSGDDAELAVLALADLSVDVVRDGVEAIGYLRDRPVPAVVFLDIKLPRVDGFEVLAELRRAERTRWVPVVMLSSSDAGEDIDRAYALGANSYVRKPIVFDEYRDTVGRMGRYWLEINERQR
jgi:two-component system response regulator